MIKKLLLILVTITLSAGLFSFALAGCSKAAKECCCQSCCCNK